MTNRAERFAALQYELGAGVFQPAKPGELAYLHGAILLAYQLLFAEKLVEDGHLKAADCSARVEHPFTWGYIFGVAAHLIEREGWSRDSGEALDLILRLHQEVYGPRPLEEIVERSDTASGLPIFDAGMESGGLDASSITDGSGRPRVGLLQFLADSDFGLPRP